MGNITRNIIGSVITVAIGGSVYTVSQTDIVNNFSKETGMTQQESQQYVDKIKNNLVSWDKVGETFVSDGQKDLASAAEIDCVNYTYNWVSPTLSCEDGKAKIFEIGNDEVLLGRAYTKLSLDSATRADIPEVIRLIDKVNMHYGSEIVVRLLDAASIDEMKNTNSYNKASLQAVLDAK